MLTGIQRAFFFLFDLNQLLGIIAHFTLFKHQLCSHLHLPRCSTAFFTPFCSRWHLFTYMLFSSTDCVLLKSSDCVLLISESPEPPDRHSNTYWTHAQVYFALVLDSSDVRWPGTSSRHAAALLPGKRNESLFFFMKCYCHTSIPSWNHRDAIREIHSISRIFILQTIKTVSVLLQSPDWWLFTPEWRPSASGRFVMWSALSQWCMVVSLVSWKNLGASWTPPPAMNYLGVIMQWRKRGSIPPLSLPWGVTRKLTVLCEVNHF